MLRQHLALVRVISVLLCSLMISPSFAIAEAHGSHHNGESLSFVSLPLLTANIRRDNGTLGVVSLQIGLDIDDSNLRMKAQRMIPILQSEYRPIFAKTTKITPLGRVPDLDQLSLLLQAKTNEILGKSGAHLLLGSMLMD